MTKQALRRKPRILNPRQVFFLILGLSVFCGIVVGGIIGLILGYIFRNSLFGLGEFAGLLAGLSIAYPLGNIAGLALARLHFKFDGSLWVGTIACLVCSIIFFGIMVLIDIPVIWVSALVFIAPLSGVGGFLAGKHIGKARQRG